MSQPINYLPVTFQIIPAMKFSLALTCAALVGIASTHAAALDDVRALNSKDQFAEAITKAETAARASGKDTAALQAELVDAYLGAGRLLAANQLADKLLKDIPTGPLKARLLFACARAKEANGWSAKALALYRTAAEVVPPTPERPEALIAAARVASTLVRDAREEARALRDFVESYSKDPRARDAHERLVSHLIRQNDHKNAAAFIASYTKTYPDDPACAAMNEYYHLRQINDLPAAVAAWDRKRQSPHFVLDAGTVAQSFDLLRQNKDYFVRLEKLCQDYQEATGDPAYLLSLITQVYEPANEMDRVIRLGSALMQKYPNTTLSRQVRLAVASAQQKINKIADAEKLLVAAIADEPANMTAWSRYDLLVTVDKRPAAFTQLATATLAANANQANPAIKATVANELTYALARKAAQAKDHAATLKLATTYLETTGLAHSGELIGWAFDSSFAVTNNFDTLTASLEKYFTRLPAAWNPAVAYTEGVAREWAKGGKQAPHPVEGKKLLEMLTRVRGTDAQKQMSQMQQARSTSKWKNAGELGAALAPTLPAGSLLQTEIGISAIEALTSASQFEKAGDLAKTLAPASKGHTPLLWAGAQAYLRLAKPKSADAIPLLKEIAQRGYAPLDPAAVRGTLFQVYEANGLLAEAQTELTEISKLSPGSLNNRELERRLAVALATAGKTNEATQIIQKLAKLAKPYNGDLALISDFTPVNAAHAAWIVPILDDYLKRPNRGPNQIVALNTKGRFTHYALTNNAAAEKILREQSARSADYLFAARGPHVDWMDATISRITSTPDYTADQLQLIKDGIKIYTAYPTWIKAALTGSARLNQPIEFAQYLNRFASSFGPSDAGRFTELVTLARQLADDKTPELAGMVLLKADSHFKSVDEKTRAQGRQFLYTLNKDSALGLGTVIIDPSVPYSVFLVAAESFRNSELESAWKAYTVNEAIFPKNLDNIPVDYIRYVAGRLMLLEDEVSREKAESYLRRWIIANDAVTAISADEKALTQQQLGSLYFKSQRYDLARSEFTALRNKYPGTTAAGDAIFRIGECYMEQKMYSDAFKIFEKLAGSKVREEVARAEFLMGVLALRKGDSEEAKNRFRSVMDLSPSSDVSNQVLFRLSELYGADGRFGDQLNLLRSVGLIGSSAKRWMLPGGPLNIVIHDADLGVSRGQSYVPVIVTTSSGDRETVRLESGTAGKGFFRADLLTELGDVKAGDGKLQVNGKDVINYDYPDDFKKQFSNIPPLPSNIQVASDGKFMVSATEIKEDDEAEGKPVATKRKADDDDNRIQYRQGNEIKPGNNIYLYVKDADRDTSGEADVIEVLVETSNGNTARARLTETGPHTGTFFGTLKTYELTQNAMASDQSLNNQPFKAVDNDRNTAWEGQNDGNTPKTLTLDLREKLGLGGIRWWPDPTTPEKTPLEYVIQISDDQQTWKTVATTVGASGATKALTDIIKPIPGENALGTVIALGTNATARYVRFVIEKFNGSAPRITEVEITDPAGKVLLPLKSTPKPADGQALAVSPGETVTATYADEVNLINPGKPRNLSQALKATYYNGKVAAIGYHFSDSGGGGIPQSHVKAVRRVEPGDRIIVQITDYDADTTNQRDKIQFTVKTSGGQTFKSEATETESYTGVFTKEVDIKGEKRPDGIALAPGETLEITYLDEQNTQPGTPTVRSTAVEAVTHVEPKISVMESRVIYNKEGKETKFDFASTLGQDLPVKSVAFTAPFVFEVLDPTAAKDSFSEVKVTLTTSGGASVEVICPLSLSLSGAKAKKAGTTPDTALDLGRFVGQIVLALGDKDSPNTTSLDPWDLRLTTQISRSTPFRKGDSLADNVVPVLNLNGRDIITTSYKRLTTQTNIPAAEAKDQARLAVPVVVGYFDSAYDRPMTNAHVGEKIYLRIEDLAADVSGELDAIDVEVTTSSGEKLKLKLKETLGHSGIFTGNLLLEPGQKPDPADDKLTAWFGDTITTSYKPGGTNTTTPAVTMDLPVARGTDGILASFQKKFSGENIAVETQFRMAEACFELFKNFRALKQQQQADDVLRDGMQILRELTEEYGATTYRARMSYLLAQFAQELKNYDEAITHYQRIVRQHAESTLAPDAHYKLAQCYEEKGDINTATEQYVTLAYTYPDSPLVANVMVRISDYFYKKEDYETAAQTARKFVERFPTHEWAERLAFRTAQSYSKASKFAEAAKEFDAFVEAYPKSTFRPMALFWSGESYRSASVLKSAYQRYKRTTWDYPESEAAKYARGRLVQPEMANMADSDNNN